MAVAKKITPYVRVLGINQKGKTILSDICQIDKKLNIITSVKKFEDINLSKNLEQMLQKDIYATNIYTLGYEYESWSNLDYTNKLIVI